MASRTFTKLDHRIFWALWRWAKRRHPNKGRRWIRRRYFGSSPTRSWVFTSGNQTLARVSDCKVRRHVKVKAEANPYDPSWDGYFEERLGRKMAQTLMGRRKLLWLWQRQAGACPRCQQKITLRTGWHVHHRVWKCFGGTDRPSNLELLHPNCHRQLHALAKSRRSLLERGGFVAA